MEAPITRQLTLKLLVDKPSNKVLFAEAGKGVVDFLLGLPALPLGSVVNLLTDDYVALGPIANIRNSTRALPDSYFQSDQSKSALLHATRPTHSPLPDGFLPAVPADRKLFSCTNRFIGMSHPAFCSERPRHGDDDEDDDEFFNRCGKFVTDVRGARCPNCNGMMMTDMNVVVPEKTGGDAEGSAGYVKGAVAYTVTDDLCISPVSSISAISAINLLNKLNIKDVRDLEEKTVVLGHYEGIQLLRASMMQSKSVLTDVFLGRKRGDRASPMCREKRRRG